MRKVGCHTSHTQPTNLRLKMPNIAVIGSGSWATAIVKLLSEKDTRIQWWMRKPEYVDHVKRYRHNKNYLSDVTIDLSKVTPTADLEQALDGADTAFLVVPSAFLKPVLEQAGPLLQGKLIASGVKGIVPDDNELITDYLEKRFGLDSTKMCILSGPCHAEEIAMEKQSYLTIGGLDKSQGRKVANMLACRYLKTTISPDLFGLEYASIIKNIAAIACGIAHGLNYGDNFMAVLVAGSLYELDAFLHKASPYKGRKVTASGYAGDMLVTCYSQFSRNRTFGTMIGRGYSVKAAQMEMNMIAEGYYASRCIHEMNQAQWQVQMPIVDSVYRILYGKEPSASVFKELESLIA